MKGRRGTEREGEGGREVKRQETWRVRIRSVMPAVDAIADGQIDDA